MFCEHYFLPQVKNTWSIKRYFHTFFFSRLFCFSFNKVAFKRFPCVEWSFETSFWKKLARKNVKKSWKIISNLCILHWGFCIINYYEQKNNYKWPKWNSENKTYTLYLIQKQLSANTLQNKCSLKLCKIHMKNSLSKN